MRYTINKKHYRDFDVFQKNRLPHRSYFIPFLSREALEKTTYLTERFESDAVLLLSGEWDFRYYESAALLKSAFYTDETEFDKVPVPSTWQKTGYDTVNYLNSMYPFRCNPPVTPKNCPVSVYRKRFTLQKEKDFTYFITFLGVSASLDLYVNGAFVGYGEGSHNSREFDLTKFLKNGENELVAVVYKWSTGTYLECQDMFRENGIFRDVYITKQPKAYLYDFQFQTEKTANGYNAAVNFTLHGDATLRAALYDGGKLLAEAAGSADAPLAFHNLAVREWNAEIPVCYDLILTVLQDGKELQFIRQKVGFRTIELDGCRYLLNSKPIKLKGVNHHDTHPVRGYAMTKDDLLKDVTLMKEYNVNCIRTSHYPPDPLLLIMSDVYGIYVVDEADIETHGCFVKNDNLISDDPKWESHYLDRVEALYERDKNHPCVVMWSMGNEAGGIKNFDACYAYLKSKSNIPVHYEPACRSERIRYDILAHFYTPTDEMRALRNGEWKDPRNYDAPFFLCEYAHSMGVGPGGLDEYWDVIYSDDRFLGGCIWEWADHAHDNKDGQYRYTYGGDHHDNPHSGNFCCDGLFFPDRTPSPSALCMKNVYSPLRAFRKDGKFFIRNTNRFADSRGITIRCALLLNGKEEPIYETDDAIEPQGVLTLPIAPTYKDTDDAFLLISYTKQDGFEIAKEQIVLHEYLPKKEFYNKPLPWQETETEKRLADGQFVWDASGALTAMKDGGGQEILSASSDGFTPLIWQSVIDNHVYVANPLKKAGLDRCVVEKSDGSFDSFLGTVQENLLLKTGTKKAFRVSITQRAVDENKICVTVVYRSLLNQPIDMLQMGVTLRLNGRYENVRYYGMGDTESYSDFSAQDVMGLYETTASDMAVSYIKPQESGNRSGVRFAELTDANGHGLRVTALQQPLNFKAVRIDEANLIEAKHREDVLRTDDITLHLHGFLRGIGSNSCGPDTAERYKKIMHLDETYGYSFTVELI